MKHRLALTVSGCSMLVALAVAVSASGEPVTPTGKEPMAHEFSLLPSLKHRAEQLLAHRKPLPEDRKALAARCSAFRKRLVECLGYMPPRDTPLSPRKEGESAVAEGVVQERIVYHVEPDVLVPAHIYRPAAATGRFPGILLLHGWDFGKSDGLEAKLALARAGYVVLLPDNRCSGERKDVGDQVNVVPVAGLLGMTFMGMNTFDNMRALDYLSSRDDVDANRLACAGLCWGGMQAYVLAALDQRVKVVCPVCGVSTYEALAIDYTFRGGHTCLGTFIPNLLQYGDTQDIMALIAPRPLLMQNNSNDAWFPLSGFGKVQQELETAYRAWGHPERFEAHVDSTVHEITPEFTARIIEWLRRFL